MIINYVILVVFTAIFLLKKSSAQILQPINCNLFQGCTCSLKSTRYYDIQCTSSERSRSPFPIRNNSTSLPSPLINLLSFNNYNFTTIPNRIFQDLEIESLFFNDNNLQNITSEAFSSVKLLRYLNVYERMLNIEPGVFRNLNGLEELSLSGQLTNAKLELIRNDLSNLKNLTSLSFALNNLTSFDPRLIQSMSELMSFDLSQNNLRNLSEDLLRNSLKLKILAMSFNPFNDSLHLFNNVLRPVQKTLDWLLLKSCQIENIGNMSGFSSLIRLDLSSNMISKLNNRLDNLVNLKELQLASNRLEDFDTRTSSLRKLTVLDLRNNFMNKIPNITELAELSLLIMSNQNGKLQTIQHYAFDRIMPKGRLDIDLRSNQITKFENKAFCSRWTGQRLLINRIDLNYASARMIDKCHLKQITSSNMVNINSNSTRPNNSTMSPDNYDKVTIVIEGMDNTTNYVCSCDFKEFAARFRIRLVGNCILFNENSCANFNRTWVDDCDTKPHLVCGNTITDEKSGGGGGGGQNATSSNGCINIHSFNSGVFSYYILLLFFWVKVKIY